MKSSLFINEPLWLENRQGLRHKLSNNVQSWVFESGSLTQRLRNFYGAGVGVKIMFQQWRPPFLSERRLLRLPEHKYSLTREVLLHINGRPLVLARTIIPETTIKAAKSNLSRLGNRPLGEIIFSYPKLERIAMDVTLINLPTWSPLAKLEAGISSPIWGRRTVYAIAHKQMLVSEFFLPEILRDI